MMQFSLPGFEVALADRSHTSVGFMGERWLALKLEKQGYRVSFTRPGERRGDLRVVNPKTGVITLVEVKTARRCKDGKWRFTLWKKGHTSHAHSDVVALLAVTPSGQVVPFMVPQRVLAQQKQAVITSRPDVYAGKLACWRCEGRVVL